MFVGMICKLKLHSYDSCDVSRYTCRDSNKETVNLTFNIPPISCVAAKDNFLVGFQMHTSVPLLIVSGQSRRPDAWRSF